MRILFATALLLVAAAPCLAHKQSDAYLTLSVEGKSLAGRWDIALRDLDFVLGLDADGNGELTWAETRQSAAAIHEYAFSHLILTAVDADSEVQCDSLPGRLRIDDHVDGAYAVLFFGVACAVSPEKLRIDYSLLAGIDPNHRGLLELTSGVVAQSHVLASDESKVTLDTRSPDRWQQFGSFFTEGIRHIWLGFDHLLFLFTLLLPTVLTRRDGSWQARNGLRDSALDIVKVVTAFTLAHPLTLSLAALEIISLSSRVVESAIALTVLAGALNILFPLVQERRWALALGFGLIHGLGFSSVLSDLGLTSAHLLEALLGFNVGVEFGQLVIVTVLMPAAFLIRASFFYRRILLPAAATLIGVLAVYWMLVRALPIAFVESIAGS
jgi:hypothetical protein